MIKYSDLSGNVVSRSCNRCGGSENATHTPHLLALTIILLCSLTSHSLISFSLFLFHFSHQPPHPTPTLPTSKSNATLKSEVTQARGPLTQGLLCGLLFVVAHTVGSHAVPRTLQLPTSSCSLQRRSDCLKINVVIRFSNLEFSNCV